jgi:thiamine biosynthesis lipoprotein
MISDGAAHFRLRNCGSHWSVTYTAMAGPCEVLVRRATEREARQLASLAFDETRRIEQKYSRYRDDSVVQAINHSEGRAVQVDEETSGLLEYAQQTYRLSGGLFDITSGILRRAWTFDGRETTPDQGVINRLLEFVGWQKVELAKDSILLPVGMEIDLGGIGKEYAVDRVAQMLQEAHGHSLMVNFGGDIRAIRSDPQDPAWDIGVESPGREDTAIGLVELAHGAVATSGDARRYCIVDGERLGHILNPRTGWPVEGAPRSVSVIGDFCLEAGILATLAILHGKDAESFLTAEKVGHHCVW